MFLMSQHALLVVLLVVLWTVLVCGSAMDYDLFVPDRAAVSFFAPNSTYYKTGCTYFGIAFTPRKSGRPDYMVLSVSEGPTYNVPRGLQVLIYNATLSADHGFVPDMRIAAFRVDKTQFIKMSAGVSNWVMPVLSVDLSKMIPNAADRFEFLEGQTYFIAMQVSSTDPDSTRAKHTTHSSPSPPAFHSSPSPPAFHSSPSPSRFPQK
jgi:hypothetical protein